MSRSFLSSSARNLLEVFEDAGECGSLFAFALAYRAAVLEPSVMGYRLALPGCISVFLHDTQALAHHP
jgi:hypothetical protein